MEISTSDRLELIRLIHAEQGQISRRGFSQAFVDEMLEWDRNVRQFLAGQTAYRPVFWIEPEAAAVATPSTPAPSPFAANYDEDVPF